MKRLRSDGIRQVYTMTRPLQEKRLKATLLTLQRDLVHTWRRLSHEEIAHDYPPEKLAALLGRARLEWPAICREDFY